MTQSIYGNPYVDLQTFNAYKDRITAYIADELTKFPNYLTNIQKEISGLEHTLYPPEVSQPQYFEDYDLNQDGIIDMDDVELWSIASREDVVTILMQLIADNQTNTLPRHPSHQHNWMQNAGGVFQKTLKEGRVFQGRKTNELFVVFDDEFSSQSDDVYIIDHIAYQLNGAEPAEHISIDLVDSSQDQWNWLPFACPYVKILGRESIILAPDSLLRIFNIPSWQEKYPSMSAFFGQDATSTDVEAYFTNRNFRPFKNSGNLYNISDNTSQFLPVGVGKRRLSRKLLTDNIETEITELLPGGEQAQIDRLFEMWNNTKSIIPIGLNTTSEINLLQNGSLGGGVGPGIPQNNCNIVVKNNPSFSPYVIENGGGAGDFYSVNTQHNFFIPNSTLTLSVWTTADSAFNGSYEWPFNIDFIFNFTDGSVYSYGGEIYGTAPDHATPKASWIDDMNDLNPYTWNRWKRTITIPEPTGAYADKTISSVHLVWQLGNLDGSINNNNTNEGAKAYYTGLRVEKGNNIGGNEYINLLGQPTQKTLAKLVYDCQQLFNPADVPVYSTNTLKNLTDSEKASTAMTDLMTQIKDTLIPSVDSIASSSATTIENLTTSFSETAANMTANMGGNFTISNFGTEISTLNDTYDVINNNLQDIQVLLDGVREWFAKQDVQFIDVGGVHGPDGPDSYDDRSFDAGYTAGYNDGIDSMGEWMGIKFNERMIELFDFDGDGRITENDYDLALQGAPYTHTYTKNLYAGIIQRILANNPNNHPYDMGVMVGEGFWETRATPGNVTIVDLLYALKETKDNMGNQWMPPALASNILEVLIEFHQYPHPAAGAWDNGDELTGTFVGPRITHAVWQNFNLNNSTQYTNSDTPHFDVSYADWSIAQTTYGVEDDYTLMIKRFIEWEGHEDNLGGNWDGVHPFDLDEDQTIDLVDIQRALENPNIPNEVIDYMAVCMGEIRQLVASCWDHNASNYDPSGDYHHPGACIYDDTDHPDPPPPSQPQPGSGMWPHTTIGPGEDGNHTEINNLINRLNEQVN